MTLKKCELHGKVTNMEIGRTKESVATIQRGTAEGLFYHKVLLHVKRIPKPKVNGHKLTSVAGCCVFTDIKGRLEVSMAGKHDSVRN